MKTPSNISELFNLWYDDDFPPIDIGTYAQVPIAKMTAKLGASILRLQRFFETQAHPSIIENEIMLGKKYITVIRIRFKEWSRYVRNIHTGSDLSDDFLMNHIPDICLAIELEWRRKEDHLNE